MGLLNLKSDERHEPEGRRAWMYQNTPDTEEASRDRTGTDGQGRLTGVHGEHQDLWGAHAATA